MTDDGCGEMRLLVQADIDGELAPADAARVQAHLDGCAACAAVQRTLLGLSEQLHRDVPYRAAPPALTAAVRSRLAIAAPPDQGRVNHGPSVGRRMPGRIASFAGGIALAACVALAVVLPGGPTGGGVGGSVFGGGGAGGDSVADAVVAGHIRALQPGHLLDVVSTDQHTVKPWFDGRVDFAPPVKDLKADGFPLVGGRLDFIAGRPVAALVYQRRQHVIDLFAWPAAEHTAASPGTGGSEGYNIVRWNADGMALWAVSDLGARELADFARLWQAAP